MSIFQELDQFRNETYSGKPVDKQNRTMQDDNDFFTGENLELQAKVKEVC